VSVLKVLVFIGLLGLLILIFSQKVDLSASDLGRHLTNGQAVWTNHDILFHNAYSYTEPDFPFVNHHWLFGVIVYAVYRLAGFSGLTILNILVILAAFCLAFFMAKRKIEAVAADGFYFAAFLSVPVILLLSERIEVRPEIFSYFFIILTYWLLETSKKYRRRWLLVPLLLLWVNIHIYFVIGLALIGFKAASIFLNDWRRSGRIIIIFFVSASACLFNPNTWRGLIYPFDIFRNYGYDIAENKTVHFLKYLMIDGNFSIFRLILILLLLSWIMYFAVIKLNKARTGKVLVQALKTRWFDIFISFFILGLALFSSRNISLFGLVALIIISANMAPVLAAWHLRDKFKPYVLAALLILIAAAVLGLRADSRHNHRWIKNSFGFGLYKGNDASSAFFKDNNLSGPIFNDYDIGGALIFWLHGREKVFVDNRPEAYSSSFFNDVYKPMQSDFAQWDKYSQVYGFKTIYFSHSDATPWAQEFLGRILKDTQWRLVYFDSYAVILIKADDYKNSQAATLSLSKTDIRNKLRELSVGADIKAKLRLAGFARLAAMPEMAEEIYQEVLFAWPDQQQALMSLGNVFYNYHTPDSLAVSLDYYRRALEAGLRLPEVYNQIGLSYWALGRYQEAAASWKKALKLERKNISALYYLNQVADLKEAGQLPAGD